MATGDILGKFILVEAMPISKIGIVNMLWVVNPWSPPVPTKFGSHSVSTMCVVYLDQQIYAFPRAGMINDHITWREIAIGQRSYWDCIH